MIRIRNRYVSKKSLVMFALESCIISACVLLAVTIRFWNDWADWQDLTGDPAFLLRLVLVVAVYQYFLFFTNLYAFADARHQVEELGQLWQATGYASLFLAIIYLIFPTILMGRGVFLLATILIVSSLAISRTMAGKIRPSNAENLLIIGAGETAWMVMSELCKRDDLDLRLVGFLNDGPIPPAEAERLRFPVLGRNCEVIRIAAEQQVSKIIVAMEDRRSRLPISDLVKLRMSGVSIEDAQSLMAALTGRVWLRLVQPSWFVFSDGFTRSRATALSKRVLDVCLSVIGFVLVSPLMLLVALWIKLDSKGPCLYRQVRVGFKGKPFEILKFRSMRTDAEIAGKAQWAHEGDPRVTRVGKYLRKFRLDELPQFWNIIRGDMSFVGPRPERPIFVEELRKEILYYDERHLVQPGLTGWAQVRFHYGASLEDAFRKLEYDLFYMKNMSILFDCMILFETVRVVLMGWERSNGKAREVVLGRGAVCEESARATSA
jgi:sugar transferase (PEP-CTERM system associated)